MHFNEYRERGVGGTVVSTCAFHLCDAGSIPAQCSYQIKNSTLVACGNNLTDQWKHNRERIAENSRDLCVPHPPPYSSHRFT